MGWLGWSEGQTLDTSMPAIVMAYEGRLDMLRALFGGGEDEKPVDDEPSPETDVADRLRFALRTVSIPGKGGSGR